MPSPSSAKPPSPEDCHHTFPVQGKMESISCQWCHLPFSVWADTINYAHAASPKEIAKYIAAREEHVTRIKDVVTAQQLADIKAKLGFKDNRLPRRFYLKRSHDITGISGTGRVAEGIQYSDGTISFRWTSSTPITSQADTIDYLIHVHGHGGTTEIEWIDPE